MRPSESIENWMGEVAAETATRGKYMLLVGISVLLIKLSTVSVLAFLRYRVGVKFISFGTIIWALSLHILLFFGFGLAQANPSNIKALILLMFSFILITIWHMTEARFNLHRRHSQPRHSADPGRSFLWLMLKPLLVLLKLAAPKGQVPRWWQFHEWRFQRFVEPIIIYLLGGYLQNLGLFEFGGFIQIAALCSFIYQQKMQNNFNKLKQKIIDSRAISTAVNQSAQPTQTPSRQRNNVFERPLRDRADFEKWRDGQALNSSDI